jgi:formylglycine-generating enzyme required for sulfatase activity
MHGNVWEWCEDNRVFRGGSWISGAAYCTAGFRLWGDPDDRRSGIGFRVASVPA